MPSKKRPFKKISIIGLGLIGSSIALAIKKKKLAEITSGYSRSLKTRTIAKKLKLTSEIKNNISDCVKNSDLVIICTHLSSYKSIFKKISPHLNKDAIVTDVGSAKESSISEVESLIKKKINFVPAHPIAGTEKSGPKAGFAELFEERWCIITPLKGNKTRDINKVKTFWKKLGSKVEIMTPSRHDKVMAVTAKESSISEVESLIKKKINFVPAHPIAGTEKSGPKAGFAELFEERWCIITPLKGNKTRDINKVKTFWKKLGSKVETMTPSRHDKVMAVTSHLPHLIAYNMVHTAADLENFTKSDIVKYSASGFRDFTRIASSDPTMWRDVILANREAVLEMIGRFSEDLSAIQKSIRWEDGDSLYKLFSKTRIVREKIIKAGQDTSDADFGRSKRK